MSDIIDDQTTRYLTTTEAFELFKRLQLEEKQQRGEQVQGSELPLDISQYLDSTPAYELKEEFKQFKRQVAKYNNGTWNRQEQINKELIPELKRWKMDAYQVVSNIYKYSENTRVQSRASTEIYEQLQYLQQRIQFNNEEDKQIFDGAMDQTAKLAIFGFGQAKFQDNDAKEFATKALRVPASIKHLEKPDEERVQNTFDTEFPTNLHQARFQQRLLNGNAPQHQSSGRQFGRGYFRGQQRDYTGQYTRPFGGHFQQRGRGRGIHFPSSTTNTTPTETNQQ